MIKSKKNNQKRDKLQIDYQRHSINKILTIARNLILVISKKILIMHPFQTSICLKLNENVIDKKNHSHTKKFRWMFKESTLCNLFLL